MKEPAKFTYDPPADMSALEKGVIAHLCGKGVDLKVMVREYTGAGLFTWFASQNSETEIDPRVRLYVQVDEVPAGLGVVAYKCAGADTFDAGPAGLEFHSYGEAWWGDHTSFTITDSNDN